MLRRKLFDISFALIMLSIDMLYLRDIFLCSISISANHSHNTLQKRTRMDMEA